MPENNDFQIFEEVLASDRMMSFSAWNQSIIDQIGDDPNYLWQQIRYNPWLAMAIFEDMEDKDSTLFSNLEKRREGVLALPRYVAPASDAPADKKVAEFIEETLEQFFGGNTASWGSTLR